MDILTSPLFVTIGAVAVAGEWGRESGGYAGGRGGGGRAGCSLNLGGKRPVQRGPRAHPAG